MTGDEFCFFLFLTTSFGSSGHECVEPLPRHAG